MKKSGDATRAELALLGQELLARVDPLVDRLLEPSRRTPGYSDAQADDLRHFVHRGLCMLIERMLVEGSDLHEQDRQLAALSTRRRLESGYSPADILNSLSRSIEMVWTCAAEAVEEGESGSEILVELGLRLMPLHRDLIDVMTVTIREHDERSRKDDHTALAADVASLFAGRSASSAALARALTPEGEVQVVPIRVHGPEPALARFEARHGRDGSFLAMCRSEADLVGLAFATPSSVEGALVGLGPRAGLSGLVHACAQASRAVTTGRRLGLEGIVSMESLGARVAVAECPDLGASFYSNLVERLGVGDSRAQALLDTVGTWMRLGMDVERVAHALSLHPNSVRYRLHRFATLAEVSLQDASDLVVVWWALEYQRSRSTESG